MRQLKYLCFVFTLVLGAAVTGIPAAMSAWTTNGVSISPNATNYQPFILSDGENGSIIAWHGGSGSDIFAQRLLSNGAPAPGWPTAAPLTVCNATGLQELPVMISDLAGGAIIFWQDARNGSNYDIFAQRITGSGQIPSGELSNWAANGISINGVTGNQYSPVAVSDGLGGAIVVWQDGRLGAGNYDIYAQRVDTEGNRLWSPAGVPICTAANNQINPKIVADGSGGAFITWQDYRKGTEYDIYAQHIRSDGSIFPASRFVTNGLGVCTAPFSQFYPVATADGSGGVYVAWQDYRTGTDNHIFAQHLDALGSPLAGWPSDGTPVCQAQYSQYYPAVSGDGAGGVFLAWQDYRSGSTNHIYAQHLTSANVGAVSDGAVLTDAPNGQFSPQIAFDGTDGAFVTWYDSRSGSTNDIYAQRIDQRGQKNSSWDTNGLAVCLAANTQQFPVVAASQLGTAVMTWQDLRSGGVATAAIFAQQAVGPTGTTAVGDEPAPVRANLSAARPNPSRGIANLQFTLPQAAYVRAEVLDLSGRRIAILAAESFSAGAHSLAWNGRRGSGDSAPPGVYLVRVRWPGFDQTQRIVRLR